MDNYKLSYVQSGIATDRRELNEVKCRLAWTNNAYRHIQEQTYPLPLALANGSDRAGRLSAEHRFRQGTTVFVSAIGRTFEKAGSKSEKRKVKSEE